MVRGAIAVAAAVLTPAAALVVAPQTALGRGHLGYGRGRAIAASTEEDLRSEISAANEDLSSFSASELVTFSTVDDATVDELRKAESNDAVITGAAAPDSVEAEAHHRLERRAAGFGRIARVLDPVDRVEGGLQPAGLENGFHQAATFLIQSGFAARR